MKRLLEFASLIFIIISLSSCFTGKVYHHTRVQVDPAVEVGLNSHLVANTTDSFSLKRENQMMAAPYVAKEPNLPSVLHLSNNVRSDFKSNLKDHFLPKKNKKSVQGIKKKNESILGVFGLVIAFIVGAVALILLITGFVFGLYAIMIPFWILWGLSLAGLGFSLIVAIYVISFGYDKIFGGISIAAYTLLIILAIVFLLIVLL